jgi:hypothetical protein
LHQKIKKSTSLSPIRGKGLQGKDPDGNRDGGMVIKGVILKTKPFEYKTTFPALVCDEGTMRNEMVTTETEFFC